MLILTCFNRIKMRGGSLSHVLNRIFDSTYSDSSPFRKKKVFTLTMLCKLNIQFNEKNTLGSYDLLVILTNNFLLAASTISQIWFIMIYTLLLAYLKDQSTFYGSILCLSRKILESLFFTDHLIDILGLSPKNNLIYTTFFRFLFVEFLPDTSVYF